MRVRGIRGTAKSGWVGTEGTVRMVSRGGKRLRVGERDGGVGISGSDLGARDCTRVGGSVGGGVRNCKDMGQRCLDWSRGAPSGSNQQGRTMERSIERV
jgi:hypothetical protein